MKKKANWDFGKWIKQSKKLVTAVIRALSMIFIKFLNDQCFIRAAGLAFSFLLAFIPLLALILSLFYGFGAFNDVVENLKNFLVETMLPVKQDIIIPYVDQLTTNTRALGIFGLITFLFTSIIFLNNVENNFNAIWNTVNNKNYISRFTSLTSLLVLGTLLVAASFSLTGVVKNFLGLLNPSLAPFLNNFLFSLFPFIFMFLALLLLILVVPSIRVRPASAVIGALAGSILWEIAKRLFSYWVNSSIKYSKIYGTLAAIPIFLLWIYIGWLIAMLAVQITCIHQYRENPWLQTGWGNQLPAPRMLIGFHIFVTITRRFREGAPPLDLYRLSATFSMNFNDTQFICDCLVKAGLLLPFRGGDKPLVPARDLSTIKLSEVIDSLYGKIPLSTRHKSWEPSRLVMLKLKEEGFSSLNDTTILDFLISNFPLEKNKTPETKK